MGGLSRAELASRIRADQDAWEALVADVPRERMDDPGPMGDWSFRDLVSHLAAWRNRTVARPRGRRPGLARPIGRQAADAELSVGEDGLLHDIARPVEGTPAIDRGLECLVVHAA